MTTRHLEHYEQAAVIEWAELMSKKEPRLKMLFAIPNAARRSPRQGAWMKAEGMKAGVPDLCLPVPVNHPCDKDDAFPDAVLHYNGLFIEMKSDKGKPTPEQQWWLFTLQSTYGYKTEVCHSADEAIHVIKEYLRI